MAYTREQLADLIARKSLQTSGSGYDSLLPHQQTPQGGIIQTGRISSGGKLVLYKSDLIAHSEEQSKIIDGTLNQSYIESNTLLEMSESAALVAPVNVSQFVEFYSEQAKINPALAKEVLDVTIVELLPTQQTRQQRINAFFNEFANLTAPDPPPFIEDPANYFYLDATAEVNWLTGEGYSSGDISHMQENILYDGTNGYITRLTGSSPNGYPGENDNNAGKSLQYMRDTLNLYLKDVDSNPEAADVDQRGEYEFSSNGYLEFRSMNHALIIRQEEGAQTDMGEPVDVDDNYFDSDNELGGG